MTQTPPSVTTFHGLGLSPSVLEILDHLKFSIPTPIQHQSIPVGLDGKDIIGIAQTGTGKTLAFGLPILQRLQNTKGKALILLPTRELAQQVEEVMNKMGKFVGIHTAVLIGGAHMGRQKDALRRHPRIIIATPGRLLDHVEEGNVRLNDVSILVLDEADRMLDMGFAPQINRILKSVPKDRQTFLFSATMPSSIAHLAASYMALPVRVEVAPQGTAAENVEQEIVVVNKEDKTALLESILRTQQGAVLVFSRTKFGAKKICRSLVRAGYRAAEIHSERTQNQRFEALEGFKSGKYPILVATDIAARGIDVKHIELVVNFDLPDNSEDYVHRIGRTGRAGQKGRSVSFATPDQRSNVRDIERLIKKTLKIIPLPELPQRPVVAGAVAPVVMPTPKFHAPVKRSFGPRRFGRRR